MLEAIRSKAPLRSEPSPRARRVSRWATREGEVLSIREAATEADYATVKELFVEYAASLGFGLEFQDFDDELASLPGRYAPPRGCILLADVDGHPGGCIGLRPLAGDACEMKRLYVRPAFRGKGVGSALAEEVIARARRLGYGRMRLDTVASMAEANALYASLGFREIEPYRHNPLQGARYFELDLRASEQAAGKRSATRNGDPRVKIASRLVDITTLNIDAIVNAANTDLTAGGGVCGAIHRAAGPELAVACAGVAPCPTGQARLTPGFALPARFVIHAVGPVWSGGGAREAELLASTYRASMEIARQEELTAVAFPAISTGIYGYPLKDATKVAVATVRDEIARAGSVERVVFACFSQDALDAYADEGVAV